MTLELDHVALGAADAASVTRVLTARLGGTVLGGGVPPGTGFRAMQIHLGTPEHPGMTVEALEPWEPHHNDFLVRFLARHGDAAHHITFKSKDVFAERARLSELGYEPVAVNFERPEWREMFLHPKVSHGVVIQIAQPGTPAPPIAELLAMARAGGRAPWDGGTEWWGDAGNLRADRAVGLRRVVVSSPDPESATAFYRDVLGGGEVEPGRLLWDGGEVLIEAGEKAGIDRLEVAGLDEPLVIAGTRFVGVE